MLGWDLVVATAVNANPGVICSSSLRVGKKAGFLQLEPAARAEEEKEEVKEEEGIGMPSSLSFPGHHREEPIRVFS